MRTGNSTMGTPPPGATRSISPAVNAATTPATPSSTNLGVLRGNTEEANAP